MSYQLVLLSLPLLLVLYVFYMFVVKIYLDAKRFRKMDPSLKTFISPFIGIQGVQKNYMEKYGDSHKFAKDLVAENPEATGYLTNLGYKPMLILCSAKLIKELSINPNNYKKLNLFKHSDKSYKKGIFLSDGEDWVHQRSIIGPSFNYNSLKRMIPIMRDSIDTFLNKIKN